MSGALLDPTQLSVLERMRPGSMAYLLGLYVEDLAVSEGHLAQAVSSGDLMAVRRICHKLMGSSLSIGAKAMARALEELGQQARAGEIEACRLAWRHARQVLADTRTAIAAHGVACNPGRVEPQLDHGVDAMGERSGQRGTIDTV